MLVKWLSDLMALAEHVDDLGSDSQNPLKSWDVVAVASRILALLQ